MQKKSHYEYPKTAVFLHNFYTLKKSMLLANKHTYDVPLNCGMSASSCNVFKKKTETRWVLQRNNLLPGKKRFVEVAQLLRNLRVKF